MELKGKTALITGAAKRIGREISLTLAREGVTIIIHYSQSKVEALQLKKEIEAEGGKAHTIKENFLSKRGSLETIVRKFTQAVYAKVSEIDILVNNASIFYPTPLEKAGEKDLNDFLDLHIKAPFFLSQEIGLGMVKQGAGKIINMVDWTALKPNPKFIPYAISKAGLVACTQGLARALAPAVQVLSLAPGPILPAEGSTKEEQEAVIQQTLLKRFGDPKDIANTVRFFCKDTDYITGAFIPVEGGAMLA